MAIDRIKSIVASKYVKNFFVYLSSGTLAKAIPFIILPIIALKLSPADFGRIANFGVLVQLFVPLIALKQDSFLQAQFFKKDAEGRKKVVSAILLISISTFILSTFLCLLLSFLIEKYLDIPVKWAILATSVGLGTALFSVRSVVLQLLEKSKSFAKFQIAFTLLNSGLTLLFIYGLNWSWEGRVLASFLSAIVFIVITILYLKNENLISNEINKSQIKSNLKFSLPLVPQAFTPLLRKTTDKVFVTNFVSIAANGVYSLALNFANVFETLTGIFYSTYLPRMYKLLKQAEDTNNVEIKNKIKKEALISFTGILLLLIVGYFALFVLINLVFQEEYLDALNYLPLLLVHVFFKAINYYFTQLVLYTEKTAKFGILVFIVGVIHAVCSYFLIQRFGVVGVIFGMLIADIVRLIITINLSNRYIPLNWLSFKR